jgi:prepilin-type N-terminal cleavage/methylation domain-containing protein
MNRESGFSLIEVLISLALLGLVAGGLLGGLSVASRGVSLADARETAKNLAEYQIEYIRGQGFISSRTDQSDPYQVPSPLPSEYAGYQASILVAGLYDDNSQKITVTVSRYSQVLFSLESYRVN